MNVHVELDPGLIGKGVTCYKLHDAITKMADINLQLLNFIVMQWFVPRFRSEMLRVRSPQSMRTGPDQGQIGPLLRCGFFCRERFARIFLSCPTPVLSGRIFLQPITKLPSFLFKYFAVVLNFLPNEWILRGEARGYWLRPVLSTRGEQLIPADGRKEETTLPYIAFLPKSRHLSLTYTIWLRFEGELKLIEACAQKCHKILCMCVVLRVSSPKRKGVCISHFATLSFLES